MKTTSLVLLILAVLAFPLDAAPPPLSPQPDNVVVGECERGILVIEIFDDGRFIRFSTEDGKHRFLSDRADGSVYVYADDKTYSGDEIRALYPKGPCGILEGTQA